MLYNEDVKFYGHSFSSYSDCGVVSGGNDGSCGDDDDDGSDKNTSPG